MALPLGSILTKAIERLPTQSQGLLPLDDPKNWVPLKEAAHILHVSRRTVVRMCATVNASTGRAYLRYWRPTPGTMMICRRSLEEFCRLTQSDSEFWENRGKEIKPLSPRAVAGSRRRSRAGRVQKYAETQAPKKSASSQYKG